MRCRGFVYVVSLGVMVFLTMASASLLMRGISHTNLSERARNQSVALHLADAGVDQAAINLQSDDDVDILSGTLQPNLSGTFEILSVLPESATAKRVTVRGTAASEQRDVEAIIQRTPQSIFQFALFGEQTLNVSGNAITNSYDSRQGLYDDETAGHDGDVGTNATAPGGVEVGGSIFIDGQVAVGSDVSNPTSVVSGYDPAFITGGTSPPSDSQDVVSQTTEFPMPEVTVPEGMSCGDFTVTGHTIESLSIAGSPNGDGIYCFHHLTIQGGGTLTTDGSTVRVYLTGELTARGDSTVGVPSDPRKMTILMTSSGEATIEQGTLTGSTEFYGALYGPHAQITISGNAEVFGSIVANAVNVTGSAIVHYDEALTTDTTISNLYKTTVISWREL